MKRTLTIQNVIQETADTITIEFERPEDINFKAGQFLTLINTINGKEERRSYSLCSAPHETNRLAVSVKRVPEGLVSNYLNDQATDLATMEVLEPLGAFYVQPESSNAFHYVLFAGGSGITPIMAILKTILEKEPDSSVTLVDQNRNTDNIIFKSELDQLQSSYSDRLQIIHYLTQPGEGWEGKTGRITAMNVEQLLTEIPGAKSREYFMCGPDGFMEVVLKGLDNAGVSSEVIHKESFVSSNADSGEGASVGVSSDESGVHEVKLIFDGEEYTFPVEPGETILDAGLDRDIDLPYSCQSGVCTACRGKCLSGKVDLSEVEGLSEKELNEGYVLCCVGYPLTDNVVIQIG